jgi:glutamate-1-semialdehyde 2,1-aminomutase
MKNDSFPADDKLSPLSPAELRHRAHQAIPGGCHTYAKGDDQYPEDAPAFMTHGKGCRVWDHQGREYIEYGMGLRAVTLGHAYEPVIQAAYRQMLLGSNFNRPALIELEAAEALLEMLPRAEQVKFAKDGSTVLTAGLKLARAHTGRTKVAICADHPFFSYNDWFMVSTGIPGGIPAARKDETLTFRYNDIASVERLFAEHPGDCAGAAGTCSHRGAARRLPAQGARAVPARWCGVHAGRDGHRLPLEPQWRTGRVRRGA